jgi:N-acetylmuramoyl-L-alanine amidase
LFDFVKTWEGIERFVKEIARFRGKWTLRVFVPLRGEMQSQEIGKLKAARPGTTRRMLLQAGIGALAHWSGASLWSEELDIENRLSPRNSRRPRRPRTYYIVLHTTEGEEAGSLHKVQQRGEAHYFVGLSGKVYRIIDRDKIATHAGRSMWQGHSNIDNYSLGIEVVGHYNHDITVAQYSALRELLRQLKSLYGISDRNILTHSMVAYGRPNRFHHNNHRGRKRCGMIFARPDVRARLGLKDKPSRDADVEAGRLKVADAALYSFLFSRPSRPPARTAESTGAVSAEVPAPPEPNVIWREVTAWQIARERYNDRGTVYTLPDGRKLRGDEVEDWTQLPSGTRVQVSEGEESQGFEGFLEVPKDGNTAQDLAGDDYARRSTIYFFPDGLIRTGYELHRRRSMQRLLEHPPEGTRVLVGYVYGGYVKARRRPSTIAGGKWNYPSTYYRLPDGSIVSGDGIDASAIPAGTLVFYQN